MSINPMQKAMLRLGVPPDRSGRGNRAVRQRFEVGGSAGMHGVRGGAPAGKANGNYRHGARSKETMELWKLINSLR